MRPIDLSCEQLRYEPQDQTWHACGKRPAKLVTFPRTPPMALCEEHEREVEKCRAQLSKRTCKNS